MRSLSTKLILWMGGALALVFLSLNAAYLWMSRRSLEETSIATADRIADVIQRSTRYSMLKNSREDLDQIVRSIGAQSIVRRVRVFNKLGQINYSTTPGEMHTFVDRNAEACAGCHLSSQPLERLPRPDRARMYRLAGERVMGVIRPIENEPACSNGSCHAHPPGQRILGVLDIVLSLEPVDQSLRRQESRIAGLILVGGVLLLGLLSLLVWRLVRRPVQDLTAGVRHLAAGDLKYRFRSSRRDEIGELAGAFNHMAGELDQAREEITAWNRDLEQRVQEKSRELERAQERLIHSEKLASLGQMAAAVAHEINNPLAGILTYARLAEKKVNGDSPARAWLETIQHESKRCGEIVRNLLAFSRQRPAEMAPAGAGEIVQRALDVVRHKLALQHIMVETHLAPALPRVVCDAAQIEQVLVTLAVNAAEAMSAMPEGKLRITVGEAPPGWLEIAVTNNGPAIPSDALPRIFEPFFTTKQQTSGVGLGLAVAYGIVKRHNGEILVETGPETTFRVRLPLAERGPS